MKKQPLIKRARNNKEKQQTYSRFIGVYKQSIAEGFYGEAEIIVYAFLEDRLRSFMYYTELINRRSARKVNEKTETLIGEFKCLNGITSKINVIESSMKKCSKVETDYDTHASFLANVYKYINKTDFRKCLEDIRQWCNYRNEVVHGLFEKDLDDLYKGYREHVAEGFILARTLDKYVQELKCI